MLYHKVNLNNNNINIYIYIYIYIHVCRLKKVNLTLNFLRVENFTAL